MAWSSTKARVTGKIAAGGFKQPNNTLAEAIDTGAGIMAQGIMKRGEEERQEKREAKKAAAAEARRLAAAQATKEAQAKKLARNAKVLALDFTGTTDNAAAVTYFQNQLELMDGDVGAVVTSTENRVKSGQLEFIAPSTSTVDMPFQGPNVPADPTIADLGVGFGPDGKIETGSNLGDGGTTDQTDRAFRASDVAKIAADPKSDYSTQAQEMQKIFEERGTPLNGTTLPEDGSVEVTEAGGVRIKPFVKQSEIDWASVKTPAEVKNMRRLHNAKVQVLSNEDLEVLALYESDFAEVEAANVTAANVKTSRQILLMDVDALQGVLEATDDVYDPDMKSLAKNLLNKKQGDIQKTEAANASEKAVELRRSLASMDPIERENLALSLAGSDDPVLVATKEAIELMTAKKGADLSSYFTNISTPAAVEAKKLLVQNSELSPEDKKSVLDQLETHLGKISDLTTELKLTDQTFYADVKNEDGTVINIEVIAKEGGGFYSYALNKSFDSTAFEAGSIISADNAKEIRSSASQVQEKVVAPLNARRSDVTDLLRRAASIDELVRQSDGKVLTFIGGKLPSIIQRISTEYTNLNGFVSGVENISTEASKFASMQENMPTAAELTELGISADQYSRFQAQAIEFAYVYARTAMGQERTTDKDFEAAFNVVVAGSNYATFTKSLRELVKAGYAKAEQQHNLLLTHPSIKAAGLVPNSERAFGEQMVPLAKYLEGQDIQAQLQWMNTEYQAPATQNEPPVSGAVTPLSVGQQVAKIKNLNTFSVFQKAYNNPNVKPEQRKKLAAELAKIHGITTAAAEQALTMGEPD